MIKKIAVVSNTHWDREFRQSFEKTRFNLLKMMDTTIDILEKDESYHSFTMDGHAIMIEDYLEMRPEKEESVRRLVGSGRLVLGPYYTLAEQFSISHEALVRNLIFGRKTVEKYGGKPGTVAYTPSSWGQTGQYPQILKEFGLDKMMFYRGVSHDETDAEFIWEAPDGTRVFASRFALYCRYNWYYQVHRAVTRNKVFAKDFTFGALPEVPFRLATGKTDGLSYDLKSPAVKYDKTKLKKAILDMLDEEKGHFRSSIFLAMNGHDISVAFPLESTIIRDAKELFNNEITIEHTNLEQYWKEVLADIDAARLTVLKGERRSYLKKGKWTFLFPGTISARTYLKQAEFTAYTNLVYGAEMLSSIAAGLGDGWKTGYLQRAWKYYLSNHTHDANGGCAPDEVCKDMEYRYRKVNDISAILSQEAMVYVARNLDCSGRPADSIHLTVFNTQPYRRDEIILADLELPASTGKGFIIDGVEVQTVQSQKSSVFVDSPWDVPAIMESFHHRAYLCFRDIPAMGYKVFEIRPCPYALAAAPGIAKGVDILENTFLKVMVNGNGTVDVLDKRRGTQYRQLNYFTSQGEVGNAWRHAAPDFDRKYSSKGATAKIAVLEDGPLIGSISAEFDFFVPCDCETVQNKRLAGIPMKATYTLRKNADRLEISVELVNNAADHWLRANFETPLSTGYTIADSHYDIVRRAVQIPDSTGWVEQAYGTHPLRTFVALCDGSGTFAVMPKGLFEYEAFHDSTIAITLIRGCRIKLAVSEEKMSVLEDSGVQCQGPGKFEYALYFGDGEWGALPNIAAGYFNPVQCAVSGNGHGVLPSEHSLLSLDNRNVHLSAVKKAEDSDDIVLRIFNPGNTVERVSGLIDTNRWTTFFCGMSEEKTTAFQGDFDIPAKKIVTIRMVQN